MYRKNATRRVALAAGLALALGVGLSAQASAGAPRSVTGKPSDSVTRVADFYGAYIDAKSDPDNGGRLATELRKYYVNAAYLKELTAWEAKNGVDGVLHAQNVPVQWKVTDNGTADHTEAGITLTWGDGSTTKLVVDMSRSHRITHIGTKGLESSS